MSVLHPLNDKEILKEKNGGNFNYFRRFRFFFFLAVFFWPWKKVKKLKNIYKKKKKKSPLPGKKPKKFTQKNGPLCCCPHLYYLIFILFKILILHPKSEIIINIRIPKMTSFITLTTCVTTLVILLITSSIAAYPSIEVVNGNLIFLTDGTGSRIG